MRSEIYCTGSLLANVQASRLFADCKHFVDMPLKNDAETTLAAWKELEMEGPITQERLLAFVSEHFEQPGGELEDHHPTDFNTDYSFDSITDETYRLFAKALHKKWPTLCRRVTDKVQSSPNNYSLLSLPNCFIVPGGRFRELYYWDSFWTIRGLLQSGMHQTARGMIENMGHLIDLYGFIPNGNRVYYLNRSQPPLLTWCVQAYYNVTKDLEFVARAMNWLEKEMQYFLTNKLIHQPGWKSHLFRFTVQANGPRPESYREDLESAEHIDDLMEKYRLWGDIAAAAESGRDFSARWFGSEGTMSSTRTSQIIPVELNAIICSNLRIFSEFYALLGQPEAAQRAHEQFILMREAIHQVFWNEEHGCWFDYDLSRNAQIQLFFDTNLFPLFAGCAHEGLDGKRVVDYLQLAGVLNYAGGIPTSLNNSGQQWDFPSGWAPTNWIIIQGLRAAGQGEIARVLAEKWIRKNYAVWSHTGSMFEKYNVASECRNSVGSGGEYEVQEGFAWTNAVILDLLCTFATELKFDNQAPTNATCECCRVVPAPIQDSINVPPQDSVVGHLNLPENNEAVIAASMIAELASNIPESAIACEGPSLIQAI